MGLIVKLAVLSTVVVVILIAVFGLYVAVVAGVDIPGLTGAFPVRWRSYFATGHRSRAGRGAEDQ